MSQGKTLHIIGNGFDLAHGIPSSYGNFRDWILKNPRPFKPTCRDEYKNADYLSNKQDLTAYVTNMERIFPATTHNCRRGKKGVEYILWTDFEKALGNLDINEWYKECAEEYKGDEIDKQYAGIDAYIDYYYMEPLKKTPIALQYWVKSINAALAGIKPSLPDIQSYDLYLTFNYTSTLEHVYNIPKQQICHIHGDAENSKELIIGHNGSMIKASTPSEDFEGDFKRAMYNKIMEFKKDTDNSKRHIDVLIGNFKIKKVKVFGHNFGNVDLPYFQHVVELIGADVPWEVAYHVGEDEDKEKKYSEYMHQIAKANIKNYNLIETTNVFCYECPFRFKDLRRICDYIWGKMVTIFKRSVIWK